MLKDVTLGQYFPGDTPVHRLDPRTKLVSVVLYFIALFSANSVFSTLLVLKGRTPQSSHLPWGWRGWQGRPFLSNTLLGTMADIPMASATNYTLYSPSPQP